MKSTNQTWVEAMMSNCQVALEACQFNPRDVMLINERKKELNLVCFLAFMCAFCDKDSIRSHIEGVLYMPSYLQNIGIKTSTVYE